MKIGIGQDSHRFDLENKSKKLILGGITFEGYPGLQGNSDADVVLHALTNAISGITCKNILGEQADDLCRTGVTDSEVYVKVALKYLELKISHVSISIECKKPKITPMIDSMRKNIARILNTDINNIGITATSGEELTEVGKGNGISAICIVTAE